MSNQSLLSQPLSLFQKAFQTRPSSWRRHNEGDRTQRPSIKTRNGRLEDAPRESCELVQSTGRSVPGNVKIKEYETTGTDGNKILLRWYMREGTAKGGPAVLYLYGTGYIAGTVPLTDAGVATYVKATGVPFLSVEYRLTPETQYLKTSLMPRPGSSG